MRSRLLWRRLTAAAGIYSAAALGVLGTILAARQLSVHGLGLLTLVLAATGFFQSLLDVTVEEAAIKFGFRYSTAEDWGRFRRLLMWAAGFKAVGALVAGAALAILAPFAAGIWSGNGGLERLLLIAAALPLAQAPEGLASVALILRGRYDVRGAFLLLSAALRTVALGVGSHYGVLEAVVAVVLAQVVASAVISVAGLAALRRFPASAAEPLGADRSLLWRFVLQSSLATGVLSMRGMLGPLALGAVTNTSQVGYFRTAQAPQTAFASLSAPARLILLTEQTRDWERGRLETVFAGVRRYTLGAALLMTVVLPPLLWFMPDLIRIVYKPKYLPASDAARLILLGAAVQLVVGWTKTLPVSIGRPGLRVVTHAVEVAVFIPLVIVLGSLYGATGAGGAVVASSCVFAAVWAALLVRIRRDPPVMRAVAESPSGEALVL
jgi:O-antigen/teichoic acid export membrane protein